MKPAVYLAEPEEVRHPAVVLVQGLAVSKYLRPAAHALAACELLDLPGFGASDNPPSPLDVHGFAAVVADYLRDRDDDVVLAGHSSGTQVAALAATDPDLPVSRVVLGSPTVDPAYRGLGRMLTRWLKDGRHEPSAMAKVQAGEWLRAGPRRIIALLRSMPKHHLEDTKIPRPVTVVRGARDPLCTDEWSAKLGKLITLPGLPHAFPYQAPAAFASVILD
ncbi:alpha/beta fold hydrolase [Amycolatopsis sp. NPDC059657]|uniref:alpha/beta fold hydrolase n=1 Tax=Amycolatopsis sp. NPDC059657 TaxID=3346899 RepID=UPI003672F183